MRIVHPFYFFALDFLLLQFMVKATFMCIRRRVILKYFVLQCYRKKLDPLEAYVPAVILTEFQIKDLGNAFVVLESMY